MSEQKHRLQFDFSQEELRLLDAAKVKSGVATRSEVLRKALRSYEWMLSTLDPEDEIEVVDKEGKVVQKLQASLLILRDF